MFTNIFSFSRLYLFICCGIINGKKTCVFFLFYTILLPYNAKEYYIMSENKTVNTNFTAENAVAEFIRMMNVRANEIGMTETEFFDPVGIDNLSSAHGILRCLLMASGYEALYDIWNRPEYTANIRGIEPRELTVVSTVVAADESHLLCDSYPIMGGKTGTLSGPKAYNLAALVEVPETGDRLAFAVLYANQKNGEPENRFAASKQAIDAALVKLYDKKADNSAEPVCAASVAVAKVPAYNPRAYAKYDIPLLYAKDEHSKRMPASISKLMTAMLTLDYCADLYEDVYVTEDDLAQLSKYYGNDIKPGDIVTVKDLLYTMLLPSSNFSAVILARVAGEKMLAHK